LIEISIEIAAYLIILQLFYSLKLCKCDQWEYELIHKILKDYDASIRPSLNHNYTLNVTFGLASNMKFKYEKELGSIWTIEVHFFF
jgi:hypothetical protein